MRYCDGFFLLLNQCPNVETYIKYMPVPRSELFRKSARVMIQNWLEEVFKEYYAHEIFFLQ